MQESKTSVTVLRGGLYKGLLDSLVSRKQMTHCCFHDPLFVFLSFILHFESLVNLNMQQGACLSSSSATVHIKHDP